MVHILVGSPNLLQDVAPASMFQSIGGSGDDIEWEVRSGILVSDSLTYALDGFEDGIEARSRSSLQAVLPNKTLWTKMGIGWRWCFKAVSSL